MAIVERKTSAARIRGVERAFEVRVGSIGGFELRPTRLFVWSGGERDGRERILSLGGAPRSLDMPRRESELRAGSVSVRSLGNPLMTLALAGVHAVRQLGRDDEPGDQRTRIR